MAPASLFLAAAALLLAGVNAQSTPAWQLIPAACASDCAQTIEVSDLCETQYADSGTQAYGCYCNAFPSDASGCASCLNSNNAAALASLVTSTISDCPTQLKECTFECAFTTCASTDVACQCDATYLLNIFDCGSCNTAMGNTGATQLSDWQALNSSCGNQNFTGVTQSFTTIPVESPTGQDQYVAPSLTASGGGVAATGDPTELAGVTASGGGGGLAGNTNTPTSAASTSKAGVAASSGSASSASSAPQVTVTVKSAAGNLIAPATGLVAVLAAVLALL